MLPSQSSDAGPLCRVPRLSDPTEYVTCSGCNATCAKLGATRCQGAVPDLCGSYVCELCETRCWGCNLVVCQEHAKRIDGHVQCDECTAGISARKVRDLVEALEAFPVSFQERVAAIVLEVA